MTKVKNLNGTSDNAVHSGYTSWKNWWESKAGREFSTCSHKGCAASAAVGAHVQKSGVSDMKWCIIPLCRSCNGMSSTEVFEVRDYDLIWVGTK